MGFNRRKMEAERKAKADAETAAKLAAGRSGARGRGTLDSRLERAPSPANALAVRADDRRRARGPAPVAGSVPRVSYGSHPDSCAVRLAQKHATAKL